MTIVLNAGERMVIATHNPGKLEEFNALIAPHGMAAVSAGELGLPEPEETGTTFEANAELKARAAASASGLIALADDSGLAVDALGGDPGVYSARWAGPDKDFAAAMARVNEGLIAAGADTPAGRGARFVSVICLASPDGATEFFRGEVAGEIIWPPRGEGGFGYDPVFQPTGEARTFAEMSPDEKHELSHRGRAFRAFAKAKLPS